MKKSAKLVGEGVAARQRACVIKLYRLHSMPSVFYNTVKVTDNNKDTNFLLCMSFFCIIEIREGVKYSAKSSVQSGAQVGT
jgi:hypothetical protein